MKAHLSSTTKRSTDTTNTGGTSDRCTAAGTFHAHPPDDDGCGYVSTNDAVVVFVWMLMRRLRRESGETRKRGRTTGGGSGGGGGGDGDGDGGGGGFFLQTVDMRRLGIRGLDSNLFGNASVMLAAHMPTGGGGGGGGEVKRYWDEGDGDGDDNDHHAAGAMARAMRSAVNAFKSKSEAEHRGSVLALSSASTAVHLKSVITGVALSDAFMSSWQFPLWDVTFDGDDDAGVVGVGDGSDGDGERKGRKGPDWFWGSVYPQAAWTSCVIPDGPTEGGARAGVYVNVTVPRWSVNVLGSRAASVVEVLTGRRSAAAAA